MMALKTVFLRFILVCCAIFCLVFGSIGQTEDDTLKKKKLIEDLTYETQSGLPPAASKIYFSDRKFTFSGFGEVNYINYQGSKDLASEDIELYMTNMYRLVGYVAWKPIKWLVLYGEVFAELLQDRNLEYHPEYFIEVFADFLIHDKFNVRVGTHQVQLGFVNNNDEPVMFYSVNRPEVERLIIPSTWIDFGVMTYGNITKNLKWSFSAYQGLDSESLNGGTWIRRGRDNGLRFNFNSYLLNSQLIYTGLKNTELSISGIWTQAGRNLGGADMSSFNANTTLTSGYIRHELNNWTFMGLAAYGRMNDTDLMYEVTANQVLGREVLGYYLEVGYDILSLFKRKPAIKERKDNFFVKHKEMKLPIFARYEYLNTHNSLHSSLLEYDRFQKDMNALTVGFNFNTRRNIVFKANYQFRWNKQPLSTGEIEGDRVELGFGFIF